MKRRRSPLDLLSRHARVLHRHLPGAVEGNDRSLHRARVASRRLREALPVAGYDVAERQTAKARRKIRRLTRALGAVRELDVALALIDEYADRRGGASDQPIADVRAYLLAERDRTRTDMLERLHAMDIEELERRLAGVIERLSDPEASASDAWRTRLASQVALRAKRLAARVDEAGAMYAPEALHAVRIGAKKLRYALELARETGTADTAAEIRLLKRVQDALGRLHDLQVLARAVGEVGARPRPRAAVPDIGLESFARSIEEDCRRLHARYVALVPRLRSTIDAVRGRIVASIGTSARPRTARMSLPPLRRAAGDRH
jgi:CHAD domain-containing protein